MRTLPRAVWRRGLDTTAICLLALALPLPGCGKVDDPLPAQIQLPRTVQDLEVQTAGARNRLLFTVPRRIEWIEIYRQCDPKTAGDRINLLARVDSDELQEADQPGRYAWVDLDRGVGTCRYAVRFVDSTGLRSEFSNFAP